MNFIVLAAQALDEHKKIPKWSLAVILVFSLLSLLYPRVLFFWDEGWKLSDPHVGPSGLWLFITRLFGFVLLIYCFSLLKEGAFTN